MVAAILNTESLPCTQTFLSLNENLRAKKGGKEKTGLSSFSFPWFFCASSPVTRVSRSTQCEKRIVPEEEADKKYFSRNRFQLTKSFIFKLFLRGASFGKSVFILTMIYFRHLNPLKNLKLLCDWHI